MLPSQQPVQVITSERLAILLKLPIRNGHSPIAVESRQIRSVQECIPLRLGERKVVIIPGQQEERVDMKKEHGHAQVRQMSILV